MDDRHRTERGETLIELLCTIVILGITVVAILSAVAVAIKSSTFHRRQADASVAVRDYSEALRLQVSQLTSNAWCASSYSVPTYVAPSDWTGTVTVTFGSCPATISASHNTPQFQTATVTATAPNGFVETQKIVLVPNWCYGASTC